MSLQRVGFLTLVRVLNGFRVACSNRLFYHLKKDVFPYAYFNFMTQGTWYGKNGLFAPKF